MSNEEKSGLKHWVPAFVLMVCVVLAFFDKISIAVLFSDPHFQSSMGIAEDKAKLGWLMTSFLLAYGFSSVFLSFLGDIFNPKKMLFWSVTSWGGTHALHGLYHQLLRYVDFAGSTRFGRRSAICFGVHHC